VYGRAQRFFARGRSEDWIIYHAKTTPAYTYRARSPRAQRFTWRADGFPTSAGRCR
jgi:hypothetical protein